MTATQTMIRPITAMITASSHIGTSQSPHVTPLTNEAPAGPTSMNAKIVRRTKSTAYVSGLMWVRIVNQVGRLLRGTTPR